jgi:5'-3' exonuclease
MGVPGFFAWLLKNNIHNNIILNKLDKIDNLYFDANCLFHPKCFDILKLYPNEKTIEKLEKLMMERIVKYIDYIIKYVNPTELIYIAVDGVAPVAKINQQRKRRYKSVIDNKFNKELNDKYNIIKNDVWSNIVITPGTEFMIKLDKYLNEYIKTFKNIKIIYSSFKESGEGEHKIIRYIKENKLYNKTNVIYGLDADLIFLSMSLINTENVYLLREMNHIKNINTPITNEIDEKLCYVSIQNTINTYNEIIKRKLNENIDILEINIEEYDYSKDFILLCFLLGNDFIPHIPSLNIRNNGIEYLIDAYIQMFSFMKSNILEGNKINMENLLLIFSYLKDIESEYFEINLQKYKNKLKHKKFIYSGKFNEQYEREIWEHENILNFDKADYVKLGVCEKEEYKFRYYEYNFNSRINQKQFIHKICINYMNMIEWIKQYYFEINMPSWRYYYQFNDAPFISDLYEFLNDNINKKFIDILYEEPIDIETQLLSVIPKQYKHILNKNIKDKYNNISNKEYTKYMFPTKPHIELNKELYWMCEPNIPQIDIDLLNSKK